MPNTLNTNSTPPASLDGSANAYSAPVRPAPAGAVSNPSVIQLSAASTSVSSVASGSQPHPIPHPPPHLPVHHIPPTNHRLTPNSRRSLSPSPFVRLTADVPRPGHTSSGASAVSSASSSLSSTSRASGHHAHANSHSQPVSVPVAPPSLAPVQPSGWPVVPPAPAPTPSQVDNGTRSSRHVEVQRIIRPLSKRADVGVDTFRRWQ
jgi:hypothetical protein